MNRDQRLVRVVFGLGMASVGVLTLVLGYDVLLFSPAAPAWIPWLRVVGYASGIIMVLAGGGLLFERTARASTRVLVPFLLLWTATRVPVVIADPGREISWFAVAEIAVLAAGAMALFEQRAGAGADVNRQGLARQRVLLTARILLGLSLLTFGLSHFFEFAARTVSLVPAWLPYRAAWADLTGAAQIAAGLGLVFAIYPRLAARLEAAMLGAFVPLIWIPLVIAKPRVPSNWGEFLFTFALAGAVWAVAENIPGKGRWTQEPRDADWRQEATRQLSPPPTVGRLG